MLAQDERATSVDDVFLVYRDNWEIVGIFLMLQTQWRVAVGASSVAKIGIEYTAIRSVFEILRIAPRRERRIFAGLQIMEFAALAALNNSKTEDDDE